MRIGDQLLLGLISSKPQVNLSNIMTLICDYLDEYSCYQWLNEDQLIF